ncbi:MAG: phage integrase [Rhodoferax sp.]|nr:phage integrase [Rhodoferax sp.]
MPLTITQVRAAVPREKAFRLPDTGGLHLFVTVAGAKVWRMRYKIAGVEKLLTFGRFPEVTLAQARDARDAAKAQLRKGIDPSAPVAAPNETFEAIAREWHAQQKTRWTPIHADDVLSSMEEGAFAAFGKKTPDQITVPMVLETLRKIEARPAIETARRVRQRLSAVFVYAIATGRGTVDPAAVVQKAMAPLTKGRQPALTNLDDLRKMLAKAESEPGHPTTRMALRLLALTAVRPGEIRHAEWVEFEGLDTSEPVWRIPAVRMKMKREHVVPLAPAAVEVLYAIRPFTGRGPLVFPSSRSAHQPMSENAIGYMLNRAGYHRLHVPHGWRAGFSSVMNERFPDDRAVIDLMLAHAPENRTEAAYNRATRLDRRRELALIWADLLMEGFPPAADIVLTPRR